MTVFVILQLLSTTTTSSSSSSSSSSSKRLSKRLPEQPFEATTVIHAKSCALEDDS